MLIKGIETLLPSSVSASLLLPLLRYQRLSGHSLILRNFEVNRNLNYSQQRFKFTTASKTGEEWDAHRSWEIENPDVVLEDFKAFAHYFRTSKFVQLGDFQGRLVVGRIVQRVGDDLYIDFGLKFNCVCKAPPKNSERYAVNKLVIVRLIDPELSQRFLGADKDITLLEADGVLVGLHQEKQVYRV